jgi:8-oxo-dGTP diphosphatase
MQKGWLHIKMPAWYWDFMAEKGKYTYDWPRPMVTVDAVVFSLSGSKTQVLLINRGREPYKGKWAVPGGFVEIEEELEDAVARELQEETGLTGVQLEQMRTFGTCGRDPRGRQISIVFTGIATEGQDKIRPGDDAAKAKWFDIEKLPEDLAFDHDEMIKCGIEKLGKRWGKPRPADI